MPTRPPFILSSADVPEEAGQYAGTDEVLSYGRAIGRAAGLEAIGIHVERVPPGHRTSYPHAEEKEEEFVYVLQGEIDAWVDGQLHRMTVGDFAAFPSGTGIAHAFINNGDREALLLVGGEANKADNRIVYPLNPERRDKTGDARWWHDAPSRTLASDPAVAKR